MNHVGNYIAQTSDSVSSTKFVELRGKIKLDGSSGQVWSYGRELNDKNGYSIVFKDNTTKRIDYYAASPYRYKYPTD